MLVEAAQFLLDVLLEPYAALLLLRFHLIWLRVPMRNPLGEFIMLLTDPLVLRLRRFIPAMFGLDTSSLLLAFIVEGGYLWLVLSLHSFPMDTLPLLAWTALKLFKLSLYLLMAALFVTALLSWTNPHTPFAPVLHGVTEPFLRPFRRMVPAAGGFDFSLLVLFLLLEFILKLPVSWLENMVLMHPL